MWKERNKSTHFAICSYCLAAKIQVNAIEGQKRKYDS